ncbi:GNAT family N-acetyltransferase [Roseibium sp. RKSG952]|nr:GNAT family N-acetyltransferase [Roseibium sp. RKSG952]
MPLAPDVTIRPAVSAADMAAAKALFSAYADWLGIDLCFQGFDAELATLPGKYAPPTGALLLACLDDGKPVGCVAVRPFGRDGVCEMKRLYVAPEGRGRGLGQALVSAIIRSAGALGYREMVLDTLPTMGRAISLYQMHGFEPANAYYETPIAETVFFRLNLTP